MLHVTVHEIFAWSNMHPYYFMNNSVENEPILIIFRKWNREKISH